MIHTKLHKPKINISTDKNYKTVKKMVQESYLIQFVQKLGVPIFMNAGIEKQQL